MFKIGDKVKVIRAGYGCCRELIGGVYTITSILNGERYVIDADKRYTSSCLACSFELAWQPEPGDMIEVNDGECQYWTQKIFVCMVDEFYLVKPYKTAKLCSDDYNAWDKCRPIKTTHTITDDKGRTAEISEEEMEKLFN